MEPRDAGRHAHDRIRAILDDPAMRGSRLAEAIAGLGDAEPFRTLLAGLIHLDIPEAEAHRTVVQIEEHRGALEQSLGRDPGFCVAALDLLGDIDGSLGNAAIREPVFAAPAPAAGSGIESEASFLSRIAGEARRSARYGRPLAFVIIAPDASDADAGGPMLVGAAALLRETVREADEAPALLQDAIILFLHHTDGPGALLAADRFRETLRLRLGGVWSAGIAARVEASGDAAMVLGEARQALRAARLEGGGRSRLHQSERRRHPRRPVSGGVVATVRRDGTEALAALEDLSIGGAGLRLDTALEPGARLRLTLRQEGPRGRVIILPVSVLRVSAAPEPGVALPFRAGVSFMTEGTDRTGVAGILADLAGRPGAVREERT